jgi:phosphoserine phosphatase
MRVSVILIRHGHVEGIDTLRFRGRVHLPLTGAGLCQAEQTRDYVCRIAPHLAKIYSSPLTRCITTGSIIGQPFGLTPLPREGLNDIDYGDWQGRTVAEVSSASPAAVAAWFSSPADAQIPGGETLQGVADRVSRTLEEIVKESPGEAVAIIGHDSVNRVILLLALGLQLSSYWRIGQQPGAVSRLEFESGRWSVESLNETGQLYPTLRHSSANRASVIDSHGSTVGSRQ